jgi:hypothetical protein
MKNILIISTLMVFGVLQAQTIKPVETFYDFLTLDNVYFKDVNHHYDKFIGTWECTEGPHYIKITITKNDSIEQGVTTTGRRMMKRKRFIDMIFVDYQYKYNGQLIYDTSSTDQKIYIIGKLTESPNELFLGYDEPTTACGRDRFATLKLEMINIHPDRLRWTRTEQYSQTMESACPTSQLDTNPFAIPADLIFIKL